MSEDDYTASDTPPTWESAIAEKWPTYEHIEHLKSCVESWIQKGQGLGMSAADMRQKILAHVDDTSDSHNYGAFITIALYDAAIEELDRLLPSTKPQTPRCPKCHQPMGGGRGGMPWTCFRQCKPTGAQGGVE